MVSWFTLITWNFLSTKNSLNKNNDTLCIKLENSKNSTVRIGTIFKTFFKVLKKFFLNIFNRNYEKKNKLLVPG